MPDETLPRDLLEDARVLIAEREWGKVVALVTSLHPADLSDLVLSLGEEERRLLLDQLPTDVVGRLFEFVEDDDLRDLIRSVGIEDLPAVLDEVDDDIAADVIQQLTPADAVETLAALDRGDEVAELMQYAIDSAGGIMSRGYVALNQDIPVSQAIEYLRVLRPPSEKAYYLYVIDQDRHLIGTVSIRDLLVSSPRTRLAEITNHEIHTVTTNTDQEEAARVLQRYNLLALPVVDEEGRLEGVTAADDLIDVIEEEATEDMYRLAGIHEEESVLSPVRQSLRRRIPWLLLNLVTAFTVAAIITPFESTISRAALLAVFMPIIAGHSGNTGTQVATLVVRALALDQIGGRDLRSILRKEVVFGLVHGLLAGTMAAVLALVLSGNPWLALVVFVALLLNVMAAGLIGSSIPLILRRLGADPAVSSIWLTTLTDTFGFLLLLGLGTVLITHLD